jgi:hypothetical protein
MLQNRCKINGNRLLRDCIEIGKYLNDVFEIYGGHKRSFGVFIKLHFFKNNDKFCYFLKGLYLLSSTYKRLNYCSVSELVYEKKLAAIKKAFAGASADTK